MELESYGVDLQELIETKAEFDFGLAVSLLKEGQKVCRKGWNGKGMWLELQEPTKKSKMTLPYIYMKTADDQLVPWLASQTDILTNDWMVIE